MPETTEIHFGPYRLRGPQGPLLRERQEVKLMPKTLAVLWELVRQAGKVVTKAALLTAVWSQTVVGEDALGFQIQTLRRALGDNTKQPRYIATVHRLGYRFIAPLGTVPSVPSPQSPVLNQPRPVQLPTEWPFFVGRDPELEQLQHLFAKTLHGERQVVFVIGEAGIGKTTLVESVSGAVGRRAQARPRTTNRPGTVCGALWS